MLIPAAALLLAFAGSEDKTCEWGEDTIAGSTLRPVISLSGQEGITVALSDCPVFPGSYSTVIRLRDPSTGLVPEDGTTRFRAVIENWPDIALGRLAGFDFAEVHGLQTCVGAPGATESCYVPNSEDSIVLGVEGEAVTVIWTRESGASWGAASFRVRPESHLSASGALILSITVRPGADASTELVFRDRSGNQAFVTQVPFSLGPLAPESVFVPSGAASTDAWLCEPLSLYAGCFDHLH